MDARPTPKSREERLAEFQEASELEPEEKDELMPLVLLWFRVGGYFKLSWQEFIDTPWPVLKRAAKVLEERESDMKQFIGYEEASMFKNLRRMFETKDES